MVLLFNNLFIIYICLNNQALVLTTYEINLFFHSEIIYQLIESITQLFSYIGSQNLILYLFQVDSTNVCSG